MTVLVKGIGGVDEFRAGLLVQVVGLDDKKINNNFESRAAAAFSFLGVFLAQLCRLATVLTRNVHII